MSLYAQAILRCLTPPETKTVGESSVTSLYAGISEGKNKNGEYINNAIDVEAWGKTGEAIARFFNKGDSFQASGNIQMQEWDDKQTGAKRRKHVFKVQRMEFLPKPTEGGFDDEEL